MANIEGINQEEIEDIRAKILEGIQLSFERLLISKKKNKTRLIISKGGKILKVKAKKYMGK